MATSLKGNKPLTYLQTVIKFWNVLIHFSIDRMLCDLYNWGYDTMIYVVLGLNIQNKSDTTGSQRK